MSAKRKPADDLDDAAFRARLAPLAAVVLPNKVAQLDVAALRTEIRLPSRWPMVAVLVLFGAAGLSGGVWLYMQWPELVPMHIVREERVAVIDVAGPGPVMPLSDKVLPILLQRGDAALAIGDVTAARLLYERAANAGSAEAAIALGKTYDIRFLPETGVRGSTANKDLAARWYRRAADLGDRRGDELLLRVADGSRP